MLVLFWDSQNQNEETKLCHSKPGQQIPLLHVSFQLNPSSVYIKECLGMRTEFPHGGRFCFEGFNNEDSFLVLGKLCTNNAISTPNQDIIIPPPGSIPNIPSISANGFPSQQFSQRRRILFTVKVGRADIDLQTGKPVNALKYNRVVTVHIYNQDEACVPHVVQYVQRRSDIDVALVRSCGLRYQDEEGTHGE